MLSNSDLTPNPELKNEALKEDYKYVVANLPNGNAVGVDQKSIYRTEETFRTLDLMEQAGVVVVSGSHGVGKSSLLRQIEAQALEQNRPALFISAESIDGLNQQISSEESINKFKEENGILLVDELTRILADEDSGEKSQLLIGLIKSALEIGVPTAIVVHATAKNFQNLVEKLPPASGAGIIIPRNITNPEIHQAMLTGAAHLRNEKIRKPQVLEVAEDAVETVAGIAGFNPYLINDFIRRFYENGNKAEKVTSASVEEYFTRNKDALNSSNALSRVSQIGLNLLEDIEQQDKFIELFFRDSEVINLSTFSAGDLKKSDSSSLDNTTEKAWLDCGLIYEENNELAVNGLLTALKIIKTHIYHD